MHVQACLLIKALDQFGNAVTTPSETERADGFKIVISGAEVAAELLGILSHCLFYYPSLTPVRRQSFTFSLVTLRRTSRLSGRALAALAARGSQLITCCARWAATLLR